MPAPTVPSRTLSTNELLYQAVLQLHHIAEGTASQINMALLTGANETVDPDYVLAGMEVGDRIIMVEHISTAAAVATIADVTDEFEAGDGVLTATTPTDRTNDQLRVTWEDKTP